MIQARLDRSGRTRLCSLEIAGEDERRPGPVSGRAAAAGSAPPPSTPRARAAFQRAARAPRARSPTTISTRAESQQRRHPRRLTRIHDRNTRSRRAATAPMPLTNVPAADRHAAARSAVGAAAPGDRPSQPTVSSSDRRDRAASAAWQSAARRDSAARSARQAATAPTIAISLPMKASSRQASDRARAARRAAAAHRRPPQLSASSENSVAIRSKRSDSHSAVPIASGCTA